MRRMFSKTYPLVALLVVLFLLMNASPVLAQSTTFTYQGRLQDGGTTANGSYDLQFTLWDASSGGTQQPQPSPVTVTRTSVLVTGGIFTVPLDFGANAFPGADRFLEIGVRPAGGAAFTILSPRQQTTATPYAIRSANATTANSATIATTATTANNATQLGGVAASQYVLTGDSRLSDSRAPTAGSPNYIQNTTSQQASSNFNILGNGTASGMLSGGIVNTATQYNIGGNRVLSIQGTVNTFAGVNAGQANTGGFGNAFFGFQAGQANIDGFSNAFFGSQAGQSNTAGFNAFFGSAAGLNNTTGEANTFLGAQAGFRNGEGRNNTAIGTDAGLNYGTGSNNTAIGAEADVVSGGLINATAVGFQAKVTRSDSLVLGSGANVGIGTPAPLAKLDVRGDVFIGLTAPADNTTTPGNNIYVADDGGGDSRNSYRIDSFNNNFYFVARSGNAPGNASLAGAGIVFRTARAGGGETDRMRIDPNGNVGIGTAPDSMLTVNGTADKPGGGSWATFSDERLKNIKGRFTSGLKAVMRLQPLRYEYKPDNALGIRSDGDHIGFGAQAVQRIIPEAVTTNDKGYLLVNNDPILWTMLNAIKEQQNQIETLRAQNTALNARLRAVEKNLRKRVGSARRRRQVP